MSASEPKPTYQRVMRYTVELVVSQPDHVVLEVRDLKDATDLYDKIRYASSDSIVTVNLVAWPGYNDGHGGPPAGYILAQHAWDQDS